ncbi:hypothetical protein MLD38_024631 [Melastoma candidum]|uniref:Uncharacterized protein n=1 Tax=Melastoma candidum TaxID=119954 RepID=A0ACB9NXZ8_9MYRT|nr:hypothetical protein MLD38_024631 [Melastoma candidum]
MLARPRVRFPRCNCSLDGIGDPLDVDLNDSRGTPRTWMIVRPVDPLGPVVPPAQQRIRPNPLLDPRNFYTGPGMEMLIQELTQNDRPGPPPAPNSSIDTVPTVRIEETHLRNDSDCCPICKEEFNLGVKPGNYPANTSTIHTALSRGSASTTLAPSAARSCQRSPAVARIPWKDAPGEGGTGRSGHSGRGIGKFILREMGAAAA